MVPFWDAMEGVFERIGTGCCLGKLSEEEGGTAGSVPDSGICDGRTDMKRKGRYVLEAAVLVPFICLLLVYLIFFTLYVHDYTVCRHAVLEAGVKGIYPDGRKNRQIEDDVERDLRQKLDERLLWIQDKKVEVSVDALQILVHLSGTGEFLPVKEIVVEQRLYRVHPCETIRRSRWLGA